MHPRQLLSEIGTHPKKRFGQNFLTSPHWVEKLSAAVLEVPSSAIWEIGPGLGALSEKLLAQKKAVTLFEVDAQLAEYLRNTFSTSVVEGDFLEQDLRPYFPSEGKVAVLSNLPYNISTPILFRLLEFKEHFSCWVLTFQRELTQRILARSNTKAYGALTILLQSHFKMESLGVLPPGAFYPPPEIQSEAIRCFPKDVGCDPAILSQVVKAAFAHRRKFAVKNLKDVFPAETVEAAFSSLALDPKVRAEALAVEQYHDIVRFLTGKKVPEKN